MAQEAPELFQHYRILRRDDGSLWQLGKGGMGTTYKAIDTELGRAVALKLINAELLNRDPLARERFVREARAAASLDHLNVATVYHLGHDGQSYFYAMKFISGETVEDRVKRLGPLPVAEALMLVSQAARALAAAHKLGIIHRDIKPANLMLVEEDDELLLKLIDFGLAKSVGTGAGEGGLDLNITQPGEFAGLSPLYASPEQCDSLPVDIRSDIYSLGITLWFMVAGEPPFKPIVSKRRQEQALDLMLKHIQTLPPLDRLEAKGVPAPVRDLLARMLAKEPEDRPQTPVELRAAIKDCLDTLSRAKHSEPEPAPSREMPPPAEAAGTKKLLEARSALESGDHQAALAAYHQAKQSGAETAPIDAGLAQIRQAAAERFQEGSRLLHTDPDKAAINYRIAADLGNADAQAHLGVLYAQGRGGLARDDTQAVHWCRKAAEQGNAHGQNNLGLLYVQGRGGLPKDDAQALVWYRKAAEQGNAFGQNNLGVMYAQGRGGLPKDDVQALYWCRKAAEQGNAQAQFNFGVMYEQGRGGLAQDRAQALFWYRKAADQGHPHAQARLAAAAEPGGADPQDRDPAQTIAYGLSE
jgi:TPR repeat protein